MRSLAIILLAAFLVIGCKNTEKNKQVENSPQTEMPASESSEDQPEKVSDNNLIIPGEQLGNIELNTLATKVYDSIGAPTSGDAAMQKSLATWDINTSVLTIYSANDPNTSEGHLIKLIRSTASNFKTKNGLGTGSSKEEIEKEFQLQKEGTFTENDSAFSLFSTTKGISFEFSKNNICSGVVIHNPDIQAGITYLPIYQNYQAVSEAQ